MKAILRNSRISPKKANVVAGLVRGKNVKDALALLKFVPKKGAKTLYKVIQSAASNAKNNFKQPLNELIITKILVTKGPTFKRSLPISRGRTHPILKRTCHITVEVEVPGGVKPEKAEKVAKVSKKEASAETPKEEKKAVKTRKTPAKTTEKKAEKASKKTTKSNL